MDSGRKHGLRYRGGVESTAKVAGNIILKHPTPPIIKKTAVTMTFQAPKQSLHFNACLFLVRSRNFVSPVMETREMLIA